MRVRLSRPILGYLDGTSLFQHEPDHGYGDDGKNLVLVVAAAPLRKDGSVVVEVTPGEAQVLAEYADLMVTGALQNLDGFDAAENMRWVMPEINTGRALLRKLAAEGVRP